MSVYTDFKKFVADMETSSTYKNWCSLHSGDCAKWQTYRTGVLGNTPPPGPPAMGTRFGQALVDVGVMAIDAGLVAPPPPPPLQAAFSFSSTGLTLVVSDQSTPGPSGPITHWHWDFGDGHTADVQNPTPHTYASANTYPITLTVTGTSPDGTSIVSHSATVTSGGGGSVLAQFLTAVMADSRMVRPTTKPAPSSPHYKPFTTIAQMESLLASAVTGDYIFYSPTTPLIVASSSGAAYHLSGHNYPGLVTLDFGTAKSQYDPVQESSGYVKFAYTGSSQNEGLVIQNCSNLAVYGGDMNSGIGGGGIRIFGLTHDCYILDFYVSQSGGSGVMVQPILSSGGASQIYNNKIRGESNRPCMNPAFDNHADKGTGFHGALIHAFQGAWHDNVFAILTHDSLRPGEVSAGHVWPEGGCGSSCEIGTDGTGTNAEKNNYYYIYGENLLMICDGTNPGSNGAKQTAGNGINWWGSVPLDGNEVGFLGLVNSTGQASHGTGGAWSAGSPGIVVHHGRHLNTNQAYPLNGLSSATDSYDRRWGITYNDCT